MKKIIIAMDGHSSCGKSTMAKALAKKIGYTYIDTGAMYRAVTLYAMRRGFIGKDGIDEELIRCAVLELSKTNSCIVVATGKVDLIASDGEIREVTGGTAQLSQVTGTGCMLGAVIATYLAEENSLQSVVNACAFFKACGEKAATDKGIGTFMVNLLDALGGCHEA